MDKYDATKKKIRKIGMLIEEVLNEINEPETDSSKEKKAWAESIKYVDTIAWLDEDVAQPQIMNFIRDLHSQIIGVRRTLNESIYNILKL